MSELEIRIGGYAPRDSSHSSALEVMAAEIEQRTAGRIEVSVLWNVLDEGLPATTLLDMVEDGRLFLCYFSTSYLGDRVSELNILETPFLFDDLDSAHQALDGALGEELRQAVDEKTGLRALGFWDNGFRHLTNNVRPIRSPSDCAGLTVRVQPNTLHEAMIAAWGATPVPVELSRGIEMIRDGEVDAQENPLANTVAYGVDRVHRFATTTAHLYGARGVFAHPGTLDALTADDRDLVMEAVRKAIVHQRRLAEEKETTLRKQLESSGMAFVDLEPVERAAFTDLTEPIIAMARRDLGDHLFGLIR